MEAAILAGGIGSRLHPLTVSLPKPLLPVGRLAIIEIVLAQLSEAGFREVTLCTGYLSHLIEAVLGDGAKYGLEISYKSESEPTGTAGALRALPVGDGPLLVMNGDLLTQFDYREIVAQHRSSGCEATVVTTERTSEIDYGIIRPTATGHLESWMEKPTLSHSVSTGVYVLDRSVLRMIPSKGRYDMPDLLRAVVASGGSVLCHSTSAYWQDIGRLDDYARACEDFERDPYSFLPRGAAW